MGNARLLEDRQTRAALHLRGGHPGRKVVNFHSEGDMGSLVEQGGCGN